MLKYGNSELFEFPYNYFIDLRYAILDRSRSYRTGAVITIRFDLLKVIQIVWPASKFLAWFIMNNQNLFLNKRVIELGAGCGLAGFVSSYFRHELHLLILITIT